LAPDDGLTPWKQVFSRHERYRACCFDFWTGCHAWKQAVTYELFSFPGFVAAATPKGVFGDPKARIVALRRRKKRPCAPTAATAAPAATTSACAGPATYRWPAQLHVEFERWRVDCPGCGGVHVEKLD
jgi:hypothetical protein